jgi:hypothetical protein
LGLYFTLINKFTLVLVLCLNHSVLHQIIILNHVLVFHFVLLLLILLKRCVLILQNVNCGDQYDWGCETAKRFTHSPDRTGTSKSNQSIVDGSVRFVSMPSLPGIE